MAALRDLDGPDWKFMSRPRGPNSIKYQPRNASGGELSFQGGRFELIASIVTAVGQSNCWGSSAIIVTWDDCAASTVPPAFFDDQGGLGFRVLILVVSSYVKTRHDFTYAIRV